MRPIITQGPPQKKGSQNFYSNTEEKSMLERGEFNCRMVPDFGFWPGEVFVALLPAMCSDGLNEGLNDQKRRQPLFLYNIFVQSQLRS